MFWAPEIDPGSVIVTTVPPIPGLDGGSLSGRELGDFHAGVDGLSLVYGRGPKAVRLLLVDAALPTQPLAALVPLGADGLDRIEAVTRLWRALNKRSVPPDGRLTAQQRRRLRYMLQAVDGHMNGASYREIAAAIYGASRVGAAAWKTSALRDSTIDLVKDGAALIAGGYRKLLRSRRRT
ncbi:MULTISPECIES: DUF2285 domain-containing protein [Hyphomicrobiales]|uniref:DUF2285 domain-containing protein n=3 Tax=Nitrobacteraceae TaxID=41294 RepID=A0A5P6P9P5_9BRAD|nr:MULTISPECIES: DUF2285 domain-containing protein [Bradyrhizobium]MCP4735279.1 DUF2285 domain-containing protein [Bosea sp. (in: a-proteobacteria)]MCS3731814.1 hypothetical protein [Bradyrhizobium betae]QFI74183.1 DUF2285 domain-containing protein [Bradyrhizobium betae]